MVLEHLFTDEFLEKKEWVAFFLAFFVSIGAILIASFIAESISGIVGVAILSIVLAAYLERLFRVEEKQELKDKNKHFWHLLKDNYDIISVYIFMFLGVYLAYMVSAIVMQTFWGNAAQVFGQQLVGEGAGALTYEHGIFMSILLNNWWVILACFVVALIAGDGAFFFVGWNASAWGATFGLRAVLASGSPEFTLFSALGTIVLWTLPYFVLEGLAYILAAITGGVISDTFDEQDEVQRFALFTMIGGGLVWLLLYVFSLVAVSEMFVVLAIVLVVGLTWCLPYMLNKKSERVILHYNLSLWSAAVGMVILGAFVEMLILVNSVSLLTVYIAGS